MSLSGPRESLGKVIEQVSDSLSIRPHSTSLELTRTVRLGTGVRCLE